LIASSQEVLFLSRELLNKSWQAKGHPAVLCQMTPVPRCEFAAVLCTKIADVVIILPVRMLINTLTYGNSAA
jgi:hypothetical protein